MINNYSRVKLATDKYGSEGLSAGDLGYIIEVYDDAYEVEFSEENGVTIAQIVVHPEEIQVDEPGQTTFRPTENSTPEPAVTTV